MNTEVSFFDTTAIVAIREQVSSCLADEVIILSLKSNIYHGLNSVGAFVWQSIQEEPKTVESIRDAILNEYDIDEDTCTQDLQDLLSELKNSQLIEVKPLYSLNLLISLIKEIRLMISKVKHLLRYNPVNFVLNSQKFFDKDGKVNVQCRYPKYLAELKTQGFCIIPNFSSPENLQAIKADIEAPLIALSQGLEVISGLQTTLYPEFGAYVLHEVQRFSSPCLEFAHNEIVNHVVWAYSDGQAQSCGVKAEFRSQPAKNELVDDWHTDTWKFRFKAMLYLTDVSPKHSPFCYLACSHNGKHWRLKRFLYHYLRFAYLNSSWANRLCEKLLQDQLTNKFFQQVQCIGKAGDLILFDARGIHRGSPLLKGNRLILNSSYFIP